MNGKKFEAELGGFLEDLGVKLRRSDEWDMLWAIDYFAIGITPHAKTPLFRDNHLGGSCTCPSIQIFPPIGIQLTLASTYVEKLESFVRHAKDNGGKYLYVLISREPRRTRPWMYEVAKSVREALLEIARSEEGNIIKVLHIELEHIDESKCRLCNRSLEACDCFKKLRDRGLKISEITTKLDALTIKATTYIYRAKLSDPEVIIDKLHKGREELENDPRRQKGRISWARPSGGALRALNGVEIKRSYFAFQDIADQRFSFVVRALEEMGHSELINDLAVTFIPSVRDNGRLGANSILPADKKHLAGLRKFVRKNHIRPMVVKALNHEPNLLATVEAEGLEIVSLEN